MCAVPFGLARVNRPQVWTDLRHSSPTDYEDNPSSSNNPKNVMKRQLILAVTCLLVGLIFGFAYWRWRQLWPLFIAHAIMDFYALHRLTQSA